MIELEISHFTGAHSHLNGITNTKVVRMNRFARCVMTAGHRNLCSYRSKSYHSKKKLYHLAFECVQQNRSTSMLSLTTDYYNLESSDMISASYYLGSGLTKLITEEFLGIKWLVHLKHNPWSHILHSKKASPKLIYDGSTYTDGAIPDFVAIDIFGKFHVLESKATSIISGKIPKNTIQKGINQVSQVNLINGVAPETRIVCGFAMGNASIKGLIIDPINSGNSDVQIDMNNYVNDYYSDFLEVSKLELSYEVIDNRKFAIRKIEDTNSYFGVDAEILEMLSYKQTKYKLVEDYLSKHHGFENEFCSIGMDGVVLIEQTPDHIFKKKQIKTK